MDSNGFVLTVSFLALIACGVFLAESQQTTISNAWSCPFETNLCDWRVEKTESLHPGGRLNETGWRIFNPHAGDVLSFTLTNHDSSKFVYLQSSSELRSELRSPRSNTTLLKGKSSAVLLSFSFFSLNGGTLSLILLRNKAHSLAWASTPRDNTRNEDNSTSLEEAWVKVAQCIPHGFAADGTENEQEVKIAFVGHLVSNSSIGLRHVKALELDSDCAPDPVLEDEDQEEKTAEATPIEDSAHVAWRFMIILSLFLCFGALFLATLVIVFGGGKKKIKGQREADPSSRESHSEFRNPSFQFQYSRLDPI